MNLSAAVLTVAVALSFGGGVHNAAAAAVDDPCPVCPSGLSVPDDTVLGEEGGRTLTCGTLMEDALEVDKDDGECEGMLGAQGRCCPTGIEDGEDGEDSDDDGDDEDDGDDDEPAADATTTAAEAVEDPCPVCAEGMTVSAETVISESDGRTLTCGTLAEDALTVEEGDEECAAMLGAEGRCCPSGDGGNDNGDDDGDEPPAETMPTPSEGDDEPDATAPDATAEAVEDPCPVCADGMTMAADTVISESDGRTFTCGTLAEDALTVEEGGEECTAMLGAEALCCPAPVDDGDELPALNTMPTPLAPPQNEIENPCPACSGGISVPGDTIISDRDGIVRTCGGLMADAPGHEEGSEVCDAMLSSEGLCCPPDDVADEKTPAPQEGATTTDAPIARSTPAPVDVVPSPPAEETSQSPVAAPPADDAYDSYEATDANDVMWPTYAPASPTTGAPFRAFGKPKPAPTDSPVAAPAVSESSETQSPVALDAGFDNLAATTTTSGPTSSPQEGGATGIGADVTAGGAQSGEPAFAEPPASSSSSVGTTVGSAALVTGLAYACLASIACCML